MQPQEQPHFPVLLFLILPRTSERIRSPTITRTRAPTSTVPSSVFSKILSIPIRVPLSVVDGEARPLLRTHEHIDHSTYYNKGNNSADDKAAEVTRKEHTELIDAEGNRIRKRTLVPDSKPGPLGAVHLSSDSADSRKAGSAKKIEHKE